MNEYKDFHHLLITLMAILAIALYNFAFGWDQDLLKRGSWGLLNDKWDHFRHYLIP